MLVEKASRREGKQGRAGGQNNSTAEKQRRDTPPPAPHLPHDSGDDDQQSVMLFLASIITKYSLKYRQYRNATLPHEHQHQHVSISRAADLKPTNRLKFFSSRSSPATNAFHAYHPLPGIHRTGHPYCKLYNKKTSNKKGRRRFTGK